MCVPTRVKMFEGTISYLAWMGVVLIQAVVHYSILGARSRRGAEEADVTVRMDEEKEQSSAKPLAADDQVPRMMPHVTPSEDEDEEESFDGDEPQMFFELLEQTGSEMMKVSKRRKGDRDDLRIKLRSLTKMFSALLFSSSRVVLRSRISFRSRSSWLTVSH